MYKKLLAAALFTATTTLNAQENKTEQPVSVEKSIFSVQAGLIGVWANNELKLSNKLVLRTEIGLELMSFTYSDSYQKETKFGGIPVFSLEPKWYYNLEKRARKGKNIYGNSGNSISLKINYMSPNIFIISDIENFMGADQINIIPKWTMRRVYGQHFIFETGFGIGPAISVGKYSEYADKDLIFADLHARIGYCF